MTEPGALDDLASDMSVFHQVRRIAVMRSAVLARLALRIGVYRGAVGARMGYENQVGGPQQPQGPVLPAPPRRPPPGPPASAGELARLLAPIPGNSVWGVVKQVKPDGTVVGG